MAKKGLNNTKKSILKVTLTCSSWWACRPQQYRRARRTGRCGGSSGRRWREWRPRGRSGSPTHRQPSVEPSGRTWADIRPHTDQSQSSSASEQGQICGQWLERRQKWTIIVTLAKLASWLIQNSVWWTVACQSTAFGNEQNIFYKNGAIGTHVWFLEFRVQLMVVQSRSSWPMRPMLLGSLKFDQIVRQWNNCRYRFS